MTSRVRISIALALAAIIVGVLLGVFLSGNTDDPVVEPNGQTNAESGADGSAPSAVTDKSASPAGLADTADVAGGVDDPATKSPTTANVKVPSFDVVRVNRRGDAVIAGRAEPGSEVTVRDGGRDIGSVVADERGEWVLLPDEPLAPGDRELTVILRLPSGEEIESEHAVVLSIPERGDGPGQTPLAVLVPRDGDGASRPLQIPNNEAQVGETDAATLTDGSGRLTGSSASSTDGIDFETGVGIDSVDYDGTGEMIISGRAVPGASLNVYVDEVYVGTAQADDEGNWYLRPGEKLTPGTHTVRVDQVNSEGVVLGRIEMPLARVNPKEILVGEAKIVVQPGNSLWRIARRAYGGGIHFSVIYEANRGNIRNPDLIYPGQVFAIPDLD